MKNIMLLVGLSALLAACAPFESGYYLDREFGKDSQAAWDAQILHKDHPHLDRLPEGMAGITAEEVIHVRHQTYTEKPQKTPLFMFGLGRESR